MHKVPRLVGSGPSFGLQGGRLFPPLPVRPVALNWGRFCLPLGTVGNCLEIFWVVRIGRCHSSLEGQDQGCSCMSYCTGQPSPQRMAPRQTPGAPSSRGHFAAATSESLRMNSIYNGKAFRGGLSETRQQLTQQHPVWDSEQLFLALAETRFSGQSGSGEWGRVLFIGASLSESLFWWVEW